MENQDIKSNKKNNTKQIIGGVIILIGVALMAKQFGIWYPSWLFSWPMILIVVGVLNGAKHQFRNSTWLIVTLIGVLFIVEKIVPYLSVTAYTWPIILIGVGLWLLFGIKNNQNPFKKNQKFNANDGNNFGEYQSFNQSQTSANFENSDYNYKKFGEEYIESTAVFGGVKRSVFSKNFKGGEITSVFGGSEINFSHADIEGTVSIETTQIFGGTKIIVPPTWEVVSEMSAVFGGVEDNRSLVNVLPDKSKVLVIRGTTVFGGIEIRNF